MERVSGFTIDGEHSLDLDDAIWVDETPEGILVQVHVSDVAGAIPRGHQYDAVAYARLETHYWAGGNTPMVPRFLADNKLSLLPNEPRHCLTTEVVLDQGCHVQRCRLFCSELRSRKKLCFAEVPGILVDADHPLHKQIKLAERVALELLNQRRAAGALALYDLNDGWCTSEEGYLVRLDRARANVGYVIIQELMILANSAAARYCIEQDVPILFRNHTAKAAAPERDVLLEDINHALLTPASIDVVRQRVHMVLNRATYGSRLLGHYGLNLPAYMHSTSPIRRYADLVSQRQMRAYVEGKGLPYTQSELDTFGLDITQRLRERRDAKSDDLKDAAKARGERRAELFTPELLAGLKPREFERVVKVIVRDGKYNPSLAAAVKIKATQETLATLDMYYLLVESPRDPEWDEVRQTVLSYLVTHPHHGASVASIGMNVAGWAALAFEHRRFGKGHAPRFEATATCGEGKVGLPAMASSLKVAKQRAVVNLLANIAKVPVPSWPVPPEPIREEKPAPPPEVEGENPVSQLQEYAQARCLGLPLYGHRRVGGEDHVPLVVGMCQFQGHSVESAPHGNKKTAKKEAAARMLALLVGREGGESDVSRSPGEVAVSPHTG